MPFTPLPRILRADVEQLASASGFGLDIGCGDGRLGAKLEREGLPILGVDRLAGAMARGTDVVGDAGALPVPEGSAALILAANLVRHLLPADPGGGFLGHWYASLRPGGILYILEDLPDRSTPQRRNYADLQDFLALAAGRGRGSLVGPEALEPALKGLPGGLDVRWGRERNLRRPDRGPVLGMLSGSGGRATGRARRLLKSIAGQGLEYGDYWWLRITRKGD